MENKMKIALFGSTGFVGSYITQSLIENNYKPKVLVRKGSEDKLFNLDHCDVVAGDIDQIEAIKKTIAACDAVIYNIGLIREFPRDGITFKNLHFEGLKKCVDVAKHLNVKRFILMSANGVKEDGTAYQSTKYQAEQYLKQSGLDYTIFRPSLIFGRPMMDRQIEFCTQLKGDMIDLPFPAPLFHKGVLPFNAGMFEMSPIYVKNVADIFVKSIKMDETIGKSYCLGGSKPKSWKKIILDISKASNKKKWMIPAPVFAVKSLASVLERFSWFPITSGQIKMLMEGNTTDRSYFDEFSVKEIDFNAENLSYLKK